MNLNLLSAYRVTTSTTPILSRQHSTCVLLELVSLQSIHYGASLVSLYFDARVSSLCYWVGFVGLRWRMDPAYG